MSTSETAGPGLRERKKQQTRETIARAALRLFAEQGYDQTTLAEIAEAADVAPRTIFAYFESKEDILLCEEGSFLAALKRRLEERPAGTASLERSASAEGSPKRSDVLEGQPAARGTQPPGDVPPPDPSAPHPTGENISPR